MNFKINAFDKLPDVNRRLILYSFGSFIAVLFAGYLLTQLLFTRFNLLLIFSTIILNDLIILLSVTVCISIIFYNLYTEAKSMEIIFEDNMVQIGTWHYKYSDIKAFSIIDLGTYYEFIVKTSDFRTPFVYFYIPTKGNANIKETLLFISQLIPYQENIDDLDKVHLFFRAVGLK